MRRRMRLVFEQCQEPIAGLTSLAIGADQVFAEEMLKSSGDLVAVLPFTEYEQRFSGSGRARYRGLLARAATEWVLPRVSDDDEDCYFYAGKVVVENCDILVAVWNGKPAAGVGGTGDVVDYARLRGRETTWIDPERREVRTV